VAGPPPYSPGAGQPACGDLPWLVPAYGRVLPF